MSAKILVVDDDEMTRHFLSHILAQQGFLLETAADGEQALTLLKEKAFDIILLDIEMPGLNGLETLKRIRKNYLKKDLPVLMVTANDQSTEIIQAFDLGANDYVVKPLDVPVLFARIRAHLESVRKA
jgi:DNA-binding response OmpR family regulator